MSALNRLNARNQEGRIRDLPVLRRVSDLWVRLVQDGAAEARWDVSVLDASVVLDLNVRCRRWVSDSLECCVQGLVPQSDQVGPVLRPRV